MRQSLHLLAAALLCTLCAYAQPRTDGPRPLPSTLYPNPTVTGTVVTVSVSAGILSFELVLFDMIGRRVATAYRSEVPFPPGTFTVNVDRRDVDTGEFIPPGYYFLAMISGRQLIGAVKLVLG